MRRTDVYQEVLAELFDLVHERTFDAIQRLHGLRCPPKTPMELGENWGIAWVEHGDDERD